MSASIVVGVIRDTTGSVGVGVGRTSAKVTPGVAATSV
jgi:hypothetical protein